MTSCALVAFRQLGRRQRSLDASLRSCIRDGVAWLDRHLNSSRRRSANTYDLYSLEKAADLGAIRTLSGLDWFARGAGDLLEAQAFRN